MDDDERGLFAYFDLRQFESHTGGWDHTALAPGINKRESQFFHKEIDTGILLTA